MRPLVAFDPANKDHRRYYAEFLEYGGWGTCPVRFVCPEDFGHDLPTMIKNSLIEYYVGKEFRPKDLFKQPNRRRLMGIGAGGHGVVVAEKQQPKKPKKPL
ncbi:MAG: hypothetical protein ACO29Y_05725 [Holophagaceae bacterium]